MKMEPTYLIKLTALARGIAGMNQGISSTAAACDTIEFDNTVKMICENPQKFAEKRWGRKNYTEPDAAELARDLQNTLAPLHTRGEYTTALQVLADAASRKAAELMIPQGIGHALSQIPYSVH